jgi:hypothetical protein
VVGPTHIQERIRVMTLRSVCVVVCLLTILTGVANAVPSVDLTLSSSRVEMGEQVVLTLRVIDERAHSFAPPQIPPVSGLDIRGPFGPSTSREYQMANGRTTQKATTSYMYHVVPRRDGRYTIPQLDVVVGGARLQTDALAINVGGRTTRKGGEPAPALIAVHVRVEQDTVYQGEGLVVEYFLREQETARVTNRQITVEPTFTGAWVEKLFDARSNQGGQIKQTIDGVRYNELTILKVALFPTNAGELFIPEMRLSATFGTPTGRRNLWGEAVLSQRTITVSSSRRSVYVRRLPAGAPNGFEGAVGRFSLSSQVDRDEVSQGDPVTWTVVLAGRGNIKSAGDPVLPNLSEFKAYDPHIETETGESAGHYLGRRTYERVLVPVRSGMVEVPPPTFVFFDPTTHRYQVVTGDRHRLRVVPRESQTRDGVALGLSQSQIRQVGNDIAFIASDTESLDDDRRSVVRSLIYWLVQLAAVLAVVGAWISRLVTQRRSEDADRQKILTARTETRRRMKDGRKALNSGDDSGVVQAVRDAVGGLVAAYADRTASTITPGEARDILVDRGLPSDLAERVESLLGMADRSRYAPSSIGNTKPTDMYESGQALIKLILRHMKV